MMNSNPDPREETEPRPAVSYLLRLWQVRRGEKPSWQGSLQSVGTGERTGFATVEALVAFLRELTGD